MSLSSAFATPKIGEPPKYKEPDPLYEIKVSYLNYTGDVISVATRNGLKFSLQSNHGHGKRDVIIRTVISMSNNAMNEILNQIRAVEDTDCPGLVVMKQQVLSADFNFITSRFDITLDYHIRLEDLVGKQNGVYVDNCDVVLAVDVKPKKLCHPYSTEGRLLGNFKNEIKSDTSFIAEYELVENSGKVDKLFLRAGTKVYTINAVNDTSRQEGVYIRSSQYANSVIRVDITDELLEYGIYRTYSDAEQLGEELLDRKYKAELTRLRGELDNSKAQFDKEKLELEEIHQRKLREYELAKQHSDLEALEKKNEIKHYYESRSFDRKDSSEWLKALPAVIVGIGGVMLAFKTLFK